MVHTILTAVAMWMTRRPRQDEQHVDQCLLVAHEDVRLAVQASFLCHESSLTKGDMATVQRHAIDDIRILGEQEHLSVPPLCRH
mmetsp:Transcript_2188/g.3973  ORF Transcript_2188/g.3973 Transcript_2188/m.3973 type:complete len:84 (-) Transcript_2188:145-396(-)